MILENLAKIFNFLPFFIHLFHSDLVGVHYINIRDTWLIRRDMVPTHKDFIV